MPRWEIQGVRKAFAATQALAGVDLAVGAGEVLALLGENGAGKSTLIKVLTGAHQPDAGEMTWDGQPYAPRDPQAARAAGVAVVYQELSLCPHLSVAENLCLGCEPRCAGFGFGWGFVDRRARDALARQALARLGLTIDPAARVGDLALGTRQLVEIARAFAGLQTRTATTRQPPAPDTWTPPRLLILDEPTSSLGAAEADRLIAAVRALAAAGGSVIWISHALEECRRVADRFVVLRDGQSVAAGRMDAPDADDAALIRSMVGREVGELYPRVQRDPRAPQDSRAPQAAAEEVLGLAAFAGAPLPRQADLALRRGEILGLYGLIGAGRSETLRALFGLAPVRAGRVLLRGTPATHATPQQRWSSRVGLVSEDRKEEGLALARPLADNLCLPALARYARWGLLSQRQLHAAATTWMARLGIKARHPGQAVGELSGGNQQKVAVARLLHAGCEILILDEPTRGIDVAAKATLYREIRAHADAGGAVLWASSYLPELLGVCDRIAVCREGCFGPARPVTEWDAPGLLAAALGKRT